MHRRELLKYMGASLVMWHSQLPLASEQRHPKLIWILLRGGMDSLHAVIPAFDNNLVKQRKNLLKGILDNGLPIDDGFLLHPELKHLHQWYRQGQFLPIVAVGPQVNTRSHFKAQDILESGMYPIDHDSGWLNRATTAYQGQALAVAHSVPIGLRGNGQVSSWFPSKLPNAEADLYTRLLSLYETDPQLQERLQQALDTREKLNDKMGARIRNRFSDLTTACAKLMAEPTGPDCAMLEFGGWDTHNRQAPRLNQQFKELDNGLQNLRQTLANTWNDTTVIITTEFGRTVAENGTQGTDHGTATAVLLAGGAIDGGKVLGDWPGLAKKDLYEGRDLMPTSTMQEWMGAVVSQHWQLTTKQLATVFPNTNIRSNQIIKTKIA